MAVKDALAEKTSRKNEAVKLTKNMSIADMIKAMEPEIKKALPQVITPERFTRMALSALNTTPKLAECSQMSFLGALMNAAQLFTFHNVSINSYYVQRQWFSQSHLHSIMYLLIREISTMICYRR